jgi:PPK2 family polyphosphate:nucleotide phosphotransferase
MSRMNLKSFRTAEGKEIRLQDCSPDEDSGFNKEVSEELLAKNLKELEELQYRLYADDKTSVLIVLQGISTAGKDGTIRKVMSAFNPQGVHVNSFKEPEGNEKDHDYLWRIHKECPPRGTIGIFNRSHYEDVLVTRVDEMIDEDRATKRIRHINDFERMLVDEGTVIIKLFLNISKGEQLERLNNRLDDSTRNWKFSDADSREHANWDRYSEIFGDTLTRTNTEYAPWWIVPSNRKWFRNLVVSEIVLKALRDLKLEWPKPATNLAKVRKALQATT